jgi:hypothetical protein
VFVFDVEHRPQTGQERLSIILEMDYSGEDTRYNGRFALRGAGIIFGRRSVRPLGRVGLDLYLRSWRSCGYSVKRRGSAAAYGDEINLIFQPHYQIPI